MPPLSGATSMIALVGGGGKTSLMFALARAAVERGASVITATTTHIRPPAPEQGKTVLLAEKYAGVDFVGLVRKKISIHRHLTLGWGYSPETNKISGLPARILDELCVERVVDYILVEADGSRNMPLKAPAAHEPALPSGAHSCLALLGLDGLFLPMRQGVFRMELALEMCGQNPDDPPCADLPAHLALHEKGLLRLCPLGMDMAVICNKAELPDALKRAHVVREAAHRLYPEHPARWYAASVRDNWVLDIS